MSVIRRCGISVSLQIVESAINYPAVRDYEDDFARLIRFHSSFK